MEGPVEERRNEAKFKGVRKRKWGKWVSEVRLPNSRERIWLGSYDTAEKAARAFDAAQFCLRGPKAKFNFPENPPSIPGGQSLSPHEIQAVAAQFANDDFVRGQRQQVEEPPHEANSHVIKMEKTSPSSTCNDEHVGQMETTTMDWSFLSMLENYPNASGPSDNTTPPLSSPHHHLQPTNTTFDNFGYYPAGLETLSSNLYSPTHLPPRSSITPSDENEDNDISGDDVHYFQQSFLWNF